jgi:hypothetical protein
MRLTAGADRPAPGGVAMASAGLEPDVHHLIRRAACLPYGLSLVQFGLPACAAEILGVPADLVERVRAALADEATRPALLAEYETIVKRRERDPEAFCRECTIEEQVPKAGCALALIREAELRPEDAEALRSNSLEAAAVHFHVHPFVILGARDLLARRERRDPAP